MAEIQPEQADATMTNAPEMQIGNELNASNAVNQVDSADETTSLKKVTLCGVCDENESKYKCPRCFLPYCSVACNKIHRENHPPDPEPALKPKEESQPPAALEPPEDDGSTVLGNRRYRHPFRTLLHSEQLKWLFKKYPRLPEQLLEIHAATQAPPSEYDRIPASLLKDLPQQHNGWSREKGLEKGKEALKKARKQAGEDGEAIREYSELVNHIMEDARGRTG